MNSIQNLNWSRIEEELHSQGFSVTEPILTTEECINLIENYKDDSLFRSRIQMEKFRFGAGEYQYFKYPLPHLIETLRHDFYPHLAPVANKWLRSLELDRGYPEALTEFLEQCHRGGQKRPTPLMLSYNKDDYNCLHQDLYGEIFFPIQGTCLLSDPKKDFSGGEFLLIEQRPRAQSAGSVVSIPQGAFVFFATSFRPVKGARGYYRVTMRHGVSKIRSGTRFTLG
ncbi:MAG TPA: 2OG-Fe(II) oxygenase, partial [Acidobacteriota bacterium]|nr:2OG-Fe(II) oxygenase [Acidobacteriota bacterium]